MKKRTMVALLLAAAVALSLGAAVLADAADGGIEQTITLSVPATPLKVRVPTTLTAGLSLDDGGTYTGVAKSTVTNESALKVAVTAEVTKPDISGLTVTLTSEDNSVTIEAGDSATFTYDIACPANKTWALGDNPISVRYTVGWADD